MTAAVGMGLAVNRRDTVHCAWHYDAASAPAYDAPAAAILEGLRPALREATNAAQLLCERLEGGLRFSSLIERIDGAALLITRNRCIREANRLAETALSENAVFSTCGNRLAVRDLAAQRWLEDAVQRLADGDLTGQETTAFRVGDDVFSIGATAA